MQLTASEALRRISARRQHSVEVLYAGPSIAAPYSRRRAISWCPWKAGAWVPSSGRSLFTTAASALLEMALQVPASDADYQAIFRERRAAEKRTAH